MLAKRSLYLHHLETEVYEMKSKILQELSKKGVEIPSEYEARSVLQEYGIRMGTWIQESFGVSLQFVAQSESFFSLVQTFLADVIFRVKLLDYLELSFGGSVWKDIQESRLGRKQTFFKLHWGIAIPF